jgi:hypothetical protein
MLIALYSAAICVSVAALQTAFCQEPGPPPLGAMDAPPSMNEAPPPMNVDKQLSKWTKRYKLSDAQQAQIRPILIEDKKQMDALFHNSSLSQEERFDSMRAIHDDETSKVSAILTDDQKAKYRKDQEQMARQPGPDGMGEPPPH